MIREKINQSAGLVYGNIGLVLYKLRETKKALRYFERSLSDSTQPNGDFVSLTNIALCHFHLKNFQGGEKYLRLAQPWIRNREDMANWSFSYGLGYLLTRDFKKAKVWFHKSLELARDVEDRRFEAESLVHLSSAYQGLRQYDSSLTMLGSSWPIAKTYGYNEIALDILRQFKSTYRSLGDHCMLALYNTQYIEMRERVHPLRLATEKAKTEAAFYEVALLESQKRNQRILEINNDSIQREKTLNIMIALCSALMLIMATVFVTSILIQRGFAATLNQKVKDRIDALDDNTKYLIAKSAGVGMP